MFYMEHFCNYKPSKAMENKMSSFYEKYNCVEDFLEEWGVPDSSNIPVSYVHDIDEKKCYLDIAQPRKQRFSEIEIDCVGNMQLLNKWVGLPYIIETVLEIK